MFEDEGVMTKIWQWYLYQIFTTAASVSDLAILEAFDSQPGGIARFAGDTDVFGGGGSARLGPEIEELRRIAATAGDTRRPAPDVLPLLAYGGTPPDRAAEIEELRTLLAAMADPRPIPVTLVQIPQTITANTTIADPGGLVEIGVEAEYQLTYDGVGGWVVTWDAAFKGVGALTVGRTANRLNVVRFRRISSTQLLLLFSVADVAP